MLEIDLVVADAARAAFALEVGAGATAPTTITAKPDSITLGAMTAMLRRGPDAAIAIASQADDQPLAVERLAIWSLAPIWYNPAVFTPETLRRGAHFNERETTMSTSRRTFLAATGAALAATAGPPSRARAAEAGGVGRRLAAELTVRKDPVSGATIRQLTDYRAHSNHAYFTYSAWYDGGRKLVILSDRDNRTNLYGVDLESGVLTQLTDWDPRKVGSSRHSFVTNPVRDEVIYAYDDSIQALDLKTLSTRVIVQKQKGFNTNMPHVTADGKYVITGFNEDLSDRMRLDLANGYVGMGEYWAAKPRSTIWRIPLAGGEPELVYEEKLWLTHFNASPKHAHLMTFCHEGPWDKVDHRMWCLDLATGKHWKIRPTAEREAVGHEYWMADGERIGYHGSNAKGGLFGSILYDNTEQVEGSFAAHCWHFHSHLLDLVVGDGDVKNPYLLAWRFRDGRFEGPKVIAEHRGSFHTQQVHVHPCVHADGTKILYTADPQGYGQVNIVEVPAWDALPDRGGLP